jgi:flagellar biosynthesis/type III secretory pathway M-ring protein FliF/YscJ
MWENLKQQWNNLDPVKKVVIIVVAVVLLGMLTA